MRYPGLWALGVLFVALVYLGGRGLREDSPLRASAVTSIEAARSVTGETGGEELLITPQPGGSYMTLAMFDGVDVEVLVDTGASHTTLRESDALRLGINPSPRDYKHTFSTANGEVLAARGEVDVVELGPIAVEEVTVFILPDDRLAISLLGLNVLRRFGRMEISDSGLRLSVE